MAWVVGTANINFVLTMQRKLLHSINPLLCWAMQLSVSNFEKGGLGFLPYILAWGAYHAACQKRLFNIRHGFEGSISNVNMACFSQVTNWCLGLWDFCSVKSLSSIRNLPWHSVMSRDIYIFSICLGKNNAKSTEFLGIIKTTFSRIRKYILLLK